MKKFRAVQYDALRSAEKHSANAECKFSHLNLFLRKVAPTVMFAPTLSKRLFETQRQSNRSANAEKYPFLRKVTMPIRTSIVRAALIGFLFFATIPLSIAQNPYTTGFDTEEDKAGWQQYKTQHNSSTYEWKFGKTGSWLGELRSSVYHRCNNVDGVPDTLENWMVSPPLRFLSPSELYLSFMIRGYSEGYGGYFGCKVYFSGASPNPAMGDYVEIADLTASLPRHEWIDTNIHIAHTAEKGYIALVYHIAGKQWFEMLIDSFATTSSLVGVLEQKNVNQNSITIFPNPANSSVKLFIHDANLLDTDVTVSIYDVFGREVQVISNIQESEFAVDLRHLTSCMYFVKFMSGDKFIAVKKMLIE